MKAGGEPKEKKGQLMEYIPPVQPPEKPGSGKRAYALKCYQKISRVNSVHLFGIA